MIVKSKQLIGPVIASGKNDSETSTQKQLIKLIQQQQQNLKTMEANNLEHNNSCEVIPKYADLNSTN
jgi:hypothetical protein